VQRKGRLAPAEIAEAVVLADLSLALTVVGQVMPFGGILLIAAVVPFAVVGARHRLRAVIAGAIAASVVGFLVVGTAALTTTALCAAFGALVGAAERRGWSRRRMMITAVGVLWPPIALLSVFFLWVFADLRKLTLDQIRNGWRGLFHLLQNIGLDGVAARGDDIVTWIVHYWYVSIPIALFGAVVFAAWLSHGLSIPALRRIRAAFTAPVTDDAPVEPAGAQPAPVPVELHDISFRYAGADRDALQDVNARVDAGELLAITGANGSGKSTLARILAGRRAPTTGRVERPGLPGLGHIGGTAIVFQRPEAQVLGVRVRDDVCWGVHDRAAIDIEHALARVHLEALADRETSTLSGGELQRLAIASAIARHPQLFVSDESTAMVDAAGRQTLVALMRELADDGVAVVHVTHYDSEADTADRTLTLAHGRVAPETDPFLRPPTIESGVTRRKNANKLAAPLLALRGAGHVYSRNTPWAKRALTGVDLVICERESVLVVGHNGSGKSTLAWILAGLTAPSEGEALLDGKPAADQVGRIGLAFQHARLQLLRPTVGDEVKVAADVDDARAHEAMVAVGLDPSLATRRVDELSGGQMRRVVLAGVLATRPRALVLDEPFAGLDAAGRNDLELLLLRLRDEHDLAVVMVSHDLDLHGSLIERVIELDDGRVVRDETVRDESVDDVVGEPQP
jgi:energy-coupling factor transport system ATP-binding protein